MVTKMRNDKDFGIKSAQPQHQEGRVEQKQKTYEMVNHPGHYNTYSMEVIDMMEKIWGREATALWCEMTAFKYRMRMGSKPGDNSMEQELKKEKWYLDKAKELRE